jgi:hypothetical protein
MVEVRRPQEVLDRLHPQAVVVGDVPKVPRIEGMPRSETVRALPLSVLHCHWYPWECAVLSLKKGAASWKSVDIAQ